MQNELPPPHPYDWAYNLFKGYGDTGDWYAGAMEMHRLAVKHLAEVQQLEAEVLKWKDGWNTQRILLADAYKRIEALQAESDYWYTHAQLGS